MKLTTDRPTAVNNIAAANDEVRLYTIENSKGTRLTACNVGAAVVAFLIKNRDGRLTDVVLGYTTPEEYTGDDFYLGTVVGRFANRIAGGEVMINDRAYQLSTREGGYHQHGGKMGFNKKIFSGNTFHKPGKCGIVFEYTSPHLEEGFPGELKLQVTYTLDDDDVWTVEYKASSSKTTLVNLTQHTYFNLSGDPSQKIEDHQLKILSHYYLPVNQLQVPTGELAKVEGTPFDFRQFKPIGRQIADDDEQLALSNGYDHSFVLEQQHTTHLKHAAVVKEAGSGIQLDVYTTEPSVHFYSGNFLNNVQGKAGKLYGQRSGLCLETQHFPDAPNHPHFPSTILNAGEEFYSKTVFKFSVEQ